jgi:hypothetical protein
MSVVERLIRGYQKQYPKTRRFKFLRDHKKIISQCLRDNDYACLALLYGLPFVEKVREFLLENRDYARCALLKKQLEELHCKIKLRDDSTALKLMITEV